MREETYETSERVSPQTKNWAYEHHAEVRRIVRVEQKIISAIWRTRCRWRTCAHFVAVLSNYRGRAKSSEHTREHARRKVNSTCTD